MCRLFETVRIDDGVPRYLTWHLRRMNLARDEFWPGSGMFGPGCMPVVPEKLSKGIVRCNIRYGREIGEITFSLYEKQIIRSLKLVYADSVDYHVKYTNRLELEQLFEQRGPCDEILIVKNGFITDTSMSNIIFYDGLSWFTPARPLLKGTCRNRLLASGRVAERDIRVDDLSCFTGCKLINAMRDPEEEEMIPVERVIP